MRLAFRVRFYKLLVNASESSKHGFRFVETIMTIFWKSIQTHAQLDIYAVHPNGAHPLPAREESTKFKLFSMVLLSFR
jgi:hypothetical protein